MPSFSPLISRMTLIEVLGISNTISPDFFSKNAIQEFKQENYTYMYKFIKGNINLLMEP